MNRDARHAVLAIVALVALTIAGCTTTPASTPEAPEANLDDGHPEAPTDAFDRMDPPAVDPNLAARPATNLPAPRFYLDDTFERRTPAERVGPHVQLESPQPPPEPRPPAIPPESAPTARPPEPAESDRRASEPAESDGRTRPSPPPTPPRSAPPSEVPVNDSPPEPAVAVIAAPATRAEPQATRPAEPPRADLPRAGQAPITTTAPQAAPPLAVEPTGPGRVTPDTTSVDARDSPSVAGYADFVWPTADDPRVVQPGSEISIVLPGTGWLYVGKEYGDGSVRLLGKSGAEGDETFRFQISEPGDYGLWFQRQDPLAGTFTNERFALRADAHGEPRQPRTATDDAAGGAETGSSESEPPDTGNRPGEQLSHIEQALRLLDAGEEIQAIERFSEALAEAGVAASPERGVVDESLARRFADVAARAPAPTAVLREFWRGLASSGVLETEAQRALLEIGIREGDTDGVLEAFVWLERTSEANGSGTAPAMPDKMLFELAGRLERPGPQRDLRRALSLYRAIVDDRPLSPYWDDSRSRIEYLQRHYIDVR